MTNEGGSVSGVSTSAVFALIIMTYEGGSVRGVSTSAVFALIIMTYKGDNASKANDMQVLSMTDSTICENKF